MRHEIRNGRVVLRKYEPHFAPLLWEAVQGARSPAFTRDAPWCRTGYTLDDSEAFVAQSPAHWLDGTAFEFALFDARTDAFCGGIGLNQPNRKHGFYNVGYWVAPSHQRQGLASSAVRALAHAAFADLPALNRLEILTVPENVASQQTARAAGAIQEGILRQRLLVQPGELRDAVLFSILRSR